MHKFWNFIKNEQNENEVELRISGEIVDDEDIWIYEWFGIQATSPNIFREELAEYKGKNITVWIDSYGGSVFAGASIYNALKNHNGRVITIVDGKAMSAASVIAMAGEEIKMSPVGIMMIHNPWAMSIGEAKDMRKAADVLDEVKETIINAYQIKTKRSRSKISEMMDNETFMSAKTAIKEGFADKILYTDKETEPIENNFMFSHLAIQNSMADSMKKFFEVAKKKNLETDSLESGAQQAAAPKPQSDANINKNEEGESLMFKDVNELREKCPDLVKQIEDAARETGAKEERARIQDIEKIAKNVDPKLVDKAKFTEPIDAKELAFQAMQLDNEKGKKYLENVKDDTQASGVEKVEGTPLEQQTAAEKTEAANKAADMIAAGGDKRRGK